MNKEELKRMFQGSLTLSPDKEREVHDVIARVSGMAYKVCGTMLVNCGDCPELTTAIGRVHEGVLSFQEALLRAATREVN